MHTRLLSCLCNRLPEGWGPCNCMQCLKTMVHRRTVYQMASLEGWIAKGGKVHPPVVQAEDMPDVAGMQVPQGHHCFSSKPSTGKGRGGKARVGRRNQGRRLRRTPRPLSWERSVRRGSVSVHQDTMLCRGSTEVVAGPGKPRPHFFFSRAVVGYCHEPRLEQAAEQITSPIPGDVTQHTTQCHAMSDRCMPQSISSRTPQALPQVESATAAVNSLGLVSSESVLRLRIRHAKRKRIARSWRSWRSRTGAKRINLRRSGSGHGTPRANNTPNSHCGFWI